MTFFGSLVLNCTFKTAVLKLPYLEKEKNQEIKTHFRTEKVFSSYFLGLPQESVIILKSTIILLEV